MSSTTETARRRDIKAGNSVADLRRRRSSMAVSLRKAKKEEGQAKRRNTARPASTLASADGTAAPGSSAKVGGQQWQVTAADVPELAKALGGAPEGRVEAARGLRKVLSLESDPPVAEVIEAGAMPMLVLCLDEHSNTDLQVSLSIESGTCPPQKAYLLLSAVCVPFLPEIAATGVIPLLRDRRPTSLCAHAPKRLFLAPLAFLGYTRSALHHLCGGSVVRSRLKWALCRKRKTSVSKVAMFNVRLSRHIEPRRNQSAQNRTPTGLWEMGSTFPMGAGGALVSRTRRESENICSTPAVPNFGSFCSFTPDRGCGSPFFCFCPTCPLTPPHHRHRAPMNRLKG